MKHEEQIASQEDPQVEAALKLFRESVHNWSEAEFSTTRLVRRSRWEAMWRVLASPVMSWGLASAMVLASVGIPVTVHHERQLAAAHDAEVKHQQELAKVEVQNAAVTMASTTMTDDELLSHVDNDIAQQAPDAMQPLVSMMSDANSK
jgi:cell division protein FtsL